MEKLKKNTPSQKSRKNVLSLVFSLITLIVLMEPIRWSDAAVIWSTGHSITGTNGTMVNLSNSGAYQVSYTLSGTLNSGDTFRITAIDGSGNTATQSYVSPSGWESSGSLLMNLGNSMIEWSLTLSGVVYTGGLSNQVVASGMTQVASLDTHVPVVTLIGSGILTLSQWATYHESGAIWTDTRDGSGLLIGASSWTVNTAIIGDTLLEYWKVDLAGNMSSHVSRMIHIIPILDTVSPTVSITSHVNNAIVTWVPLLSGLVTDTGGIANVKVNGTLATLGSW